MFPSKTNILSLAVGFFFAMQIRASQTQSLSDKDLQLDSKTRAAVIESIADLVIKRYIIPDIAPRVKDYLNTKLRNGAYDKLDDPRQFADALGTDLRESSNDRHFSIEYDPERARLVRAQQSQSPEEVKKATNIVAEKDRLANFGFKKLEIMKGNVGYLDLEFFSHAEFAGATAVAAMNFLANADAVIIDLRGTPGGESTMVQLLGSYFVKGAKEGRTHLSTLVQTYDGSIEQYWTIPYVPGKCMYDMDLYILTDEDTSSAAESLTYVLKGLNRATIIGERTNGAAHNCDFEVINEYFVMRLPVRRPVNPVTGSNWEHTGVEPHLAVPGEQALDKAYLTALEKILKKSRDDGQKFQVTWAIDAARAKFSPVKLNEGWAKKCVGKYGERTITYEKGELFYQRTGPKYKLVPLKDTLFAVGDLDDFRIEMIADNKGNIIELVGLYDDGRREPSRKTK